MTTEIIRVASAGQLGVDLGALEAALANGLPTYGYAKVGTKTPEFLVTYSLGEALKYDQCDMLNVLNCSHSPATVVVAFLKSFQPGERPLGGGSEKTINLALDKRYTFFTDDDRKSIQPHYTVWTSPSSSANTCTAFIVYDVLEKDQSTIAEALSRHILELKKQVCVLATGTCEENYPGVQARVRALLSEVFTKVINRASK